MATINIHGEEKVKKKDLSANDYGTDRNVSYCPAFTSEITGSLERSEVNGTSNMDLIKSENITNSTLFTIEGHMSAHFSNSNFSLTQKEIEDLKKRLEETID